MDAKTFLSALLLLGGVAVFAAVDMQPVAAPTPKESGEAPPPRPTFTSFTPVTKDGGAISDNGAVITESGSRTRYGYFDVTFGPSTFKKDDVVHLRRKGESTDLNKVKIGADNTLGKITAVDLTADANSAAPVEYVLVAVRGTKSSKSDPFALSVDTNPPHVSSVRLIGTPGSSSLLRIQFEEDDVDRTAAQNPANYEITRSGGLSSFDSKANISPGTPALSPDGRIVEIPMGTLVTDQYRIVIKNTLTDALGNPPAEDQTFFFSSLPEREKGQHVEFPEFTPRPKRNPADVFNPGDKVETRVVRLYYYRDAHRVAQIINRNVRSLNRAGVELKKREAENARERAKDLTDERRADERAAIRAATETRRLQHEVNSTRTKLTEAQNVESVYKRALEAATARKDAAETTIQQLDEQRKAITPPTSEEIENLEAAAAKAKQEFDMANKPGTSQEPLARLRVRLNEARRKRDEARQKLSRYNSLSTQLAKANEEKAVAEKLKTAASTKYTNAKTTRENLDAKLETLNTQLSNARQREQNLTEKSAQTEAKENRAYERSFRRTVAAQTEDPDTYVPGKVQSRDAVTQCSISVIGEGLIQLRGPIRGINKIREMINQIDAPVGQVKVGIFTVQVNGEHGDRMEKVAARIEGHVDLSRFLTNYSLALLRRAIREVAASAIAAVDNQFAGHRQKDRDRRYLYAFFGRDFIDELYAMDSEFLHTENKLLSLHSMDTVSQSQAMFILALAKNDIRQMILQHFMYLVHCELPRAEFEYRTTMGLLPHKLNSLKEIQREVCEKYHFKNLMGFFTAHIAQADTMTPMQREFIKLAQIFKSRMVAELEYKQRVIERGLIEDRANDEDARSKIFEELHAKALQQMKGAFSDLINKQAERATKLTNLRNQLIGLNDRAQIPSLVKLTKDASKEFDKVYREELKPLFGDLSSEMARDRLNSKVFQQAFLDKTEKSANLLQALSSTDLSAHLSKTGQQSARESVRKLLELRADLRRNLGANDKKGLGRLQQNTLALRRLSSYALSVLQFFQHLPTLIEKFADLAEDPSTSLEKIQSAYSAIVQQFKMVGEENLSQAVVDIRKTVDEIYNAYRSAELNIKRAEAITRRTRKDLDHRKLLEFLIDEQQEKYIELVEGTRSHIAQIDNYLKRLAIAMEDDFKVQFYDPAFANVRSASREWDVNLGQVERTTILTNNRAFAAVSPQATMEFDLPKRGILIQEAMQGAQALMQDYGALLQDPTFLAATKLFSGQPTTFSSSDVRPLVAGAPGQGAPSPAVKNALPGLNRPTEQVLSQSGQPQRKLGAALESLIPDPAIYKFETGTEFHVRPVIQPDGHSIVYDFDYLYTTNVREPVRADEKHLGRVKRHYVHTQVQTSSFELREVSRYQVALKASRTSRGVPLLEDIPGLGILFRPLPSDESSLQENIILAQSTVYPTLFDLMGLRWSKHITDLGHIQLRDTEHVVRGRYRAIRNYVFDEASRRVDGFLELPTQEADQERARKRAYRPDLYHRRGVPSPYHPGGYTAPRIEDPTGREFAIPDSRPEEYQQPPYDRLRRNPIEGDFPGTPQRIRIDGPQMKQGDGVPPLPAPGSSGMIRSPQRVPISATPRRTTRVQPAGYVRNAAARTQAAAPASARVSAQPAPPQVQPPPRKRNALQKMFGKLPGPPKLPKLKLPNVLRSLFERKRRQ